MLLIFLCMKCVDPRVISALSKRDVSNLENDYCEHASICTILWSKTETAKSVFVDSVNDYAEVLKTKKNYACLIVPKTDDISKPGVVVVTAKTLKPRCDRCLGKTCQHLAIHKSKYDDGEPGIVISPAGLKGKNVSSYSKAKKNMSLPEQVDLVKDTSVVDVIDIPTEKISFPPTEKMKLKFWKDSMSFNPFPEKKLIPKYDPDYTCPCGNKPNSKDPFEMN